MTKTLSGLRSCGCIDSRDGPIQIIGDEENLPIAAQDLAVMCPATRTAQGAGGFRYPGISPARFKLPARNICLIAALGFFACGSMPGSKTELRVAFHDTLSVQVRLPRGYDSTRAYPILIGLRGRGNRKEQFLKFWKSISKHDVIYIVPEAPYPFGYGFSHGFAWFRNRTPDSLRIAQDRTRSEEFIAAVAKAALARYGGGKAYLLGFSQGGNLAYHTSLRYRDLFQGIITFGTYLDINYLSPEKLKDAEGLKVFITHGKRDDAIIFHDGETAYRYLKNLRRDVVSRETSEGHVVDRESLDLALNLMFQKSN